MNPNVTQAFTEDDVLRAEKDSLTLGQGVTFNGSIVVKGRAIIHGAVDGDLNVGDLLVGEGGVITGKVRALTMHIHGEVKRDVVCEGLVAIHPTGVVHGQFQYGELDIERGGRILGNLTRQIPHDGGDTAEAD